MPAPKKPPVKKTVKKPTAKKETVRVFIAVHSPMHHPYQKITIPTGPPGVSLKETDSWLDCQIDRGLVKEL